MKVLAYEYKKPDRHIVLITENERFEIDLEIFVEIYLDVTENEAD